MLNEYASISDIRQAALAAMPTDLKFIIDPETPSTLQLDMSWFTHVFERLALLPPHARGVFERQGEALEALQAALPHDELQKALGQPVGYIIERLNNALAHDARERQSRGLPTPVEAFAQALGLIPGSAMLAAGMSSEYESLEDAE